MILLVGGGDGMGRLDVLAHAIAEAGFAAGLWWLSPAMIANSKIAWKRPIGRCRSLFMGLCAKCPTLSARRNILVTKAGPGTICEAFIAGLPMVLYSRMPGQEDGNVDYVLNENAGVWAPPARQVVAVLIIG